jgi:hypothetical protein
MRPMTGFACVIAFASGCYLSHERPERTPRIDAGMRRDSAVPMPRIDAHMPRVDASWRDGLHWVPVDVAPASIELERCATQDDLTSIVRVTVETSACDEPGQMRYTIDRAARTIHFAPFVWRAVGADVCDPVIRTIVRDIAIAEPLDEGVWTFVSEGTAPLAITVQSGPELRCNGCRRRGEACLVDAECARPFACTARRGDAVCSTQCERPCQPFPDLRGASDLGCTLSLGEAATCTESLDFGFVCAPAARDLCPVCPGGQDCAEGDAWRSCRWASEGHESVVCRTDEDCAPGRSCVELPFATARSCEVRCQGDHPCPGPEGVACGVQDYVCPDPKL